MRFNWIYGFGIICTAALSSCLDPPEYPDQPEILGLESFIVEGEKAYIRFEFTDGDGDMGLNEGQVDPPFDTSSYYHFNARVHYLEYNQFTNDWEIQFNSLGDSITFKYRIQDLTPTGKNKALKGVIQLKLDPYQRPGADSIRYQIEIIDRSLNRSELFETPTIINGIVQE